MTEHIQDNYDFSNGPPDWQSIKKAWTVSELQNALAAVDKSISGFLFDDFLNRSLNRPAILPTSFPGYSLHFEQSFLLAHLEFMKAHIMEPLQQQGTYDYAVQCAKRCQALKVYAIKNKLSLLGVEALRQEANLFAKRIAKQRKQNQQQKLQAVEQI